jgi:kinesin family protein 18/19
MAFRRQTLAAQKLFSSSEDSQSGTSVSISSSSTCTTTTATTNHSNYEITDTGNSTMKVVVRVRPENETEIRSNYQPVVKMLDEHVLVFDPSSDNEPSFRATSELGKRRPALGKKHKDLRFAFDHVFDETASQSDVFRHTTESIVDGVLDGINCSVFAYGATGECRREREREREKEGRGEREWDWEKRVHTYNFYGRCLFPPN